MSTRLVRSILLAVVLAGPLLAPAAALAADTVKVELDQARIYRLAAPASTIIIGNPAIADVAVIDAGKAVISGRGYGVTNLVVIDQLGRTVLERQVVVAAPSEGRVSVIRGPKVSEYACAGGCERAGGGDGDSAKP